MRYRYPAYVGAGVAASALAALLGYAQKLPCSSGGAWNSFTGQFRDACYTDIYPLYYNEGLSVGKVPYYGHPVEYPVLIGAMMQVAAWAVHSVIDPYSRGRDFYYVTIVLLALCLVAGVLATAATAQREGDGAGWKAALLVALSPALILAAFINWDLFAMALAAGGLAAWAAERQYLAGVLLGLAVATKFYPLLFFGALLLLCVRAGRMREFWKAFGAGLIAWLVVVVMLTLATLRLPSAFTGVFVLVDLALLLLYLAFAEASAAGVPSSGLLKAGGYVVLVFAALGVYLFFSASAAGTGGKALPLGPPLMK